MKILHLLWLDPLNKSNVQWCYIVKSIGRQITKHFYKIEARISLRSTIRS